MLYYCVVANSYSTILIISILVISTQPALYAAAAHLMKQSKTASNVPPSHIAAHNATVQKCGRLLFDAE